MIAMDLDFPRRLWNCVGWVYSPTVCPGPPTVGEYAHPISYIYPFTRRSQSEDGGPLQDPGSSALA